MSTYSSSDRSLTTALDAEICDSNVVDYLQHNPDFFKRNPAILGELSLPHNSGNAVSLVEKQVAILRERSIESRHKLGELIHHAKNNDELFAKTQALTIELLKTQSISTVFSTVRQTFKDQFDVQSTSILLLGNPDRIELAENEKITVHSHSDADCQIPGLLGQQQAICSAIRQSEAEFIFGENCTEIKSAAVAVRPVYQHQSSHNKNGVNEHAASLLIAVGHRDPLHYDKQTGTLFIDYIADIVQLITQRQLDLFC